MAVLSDKDWELRINKTGLVIYPYDQARLTGVGYDLAVGIVRPLTKISQFQVSDDGIVMVPAGSYCLVITKEYVWLSARYIGTLHSRAGLATKGLFVNATTIDPNFRGQLIMSITNASDAAINLKEGEKFLTLVIHEARSQTTTQVGPEGTRNALTVLQEMRDEIYQEEKTDTLLQSKRVQQRRSIDDLNAYLNASNTSLEPIFAKQITNSSGRFPRNARASKSRHFAVLSKRFFGSLTNVAGSLLLLLAAYLAIALISDMITSDNTVDTIRSLALAVGAVAGLLILIVNNIKERS